MSIDPRVFRQTIGQFATGVTIITTEIAGTVRALTVNSFTALSLDPPLVLFCVGKATKTGVVIHEAPGFAVNILRQEQQDLSSYFAGGWTRTFPPTFSFLEWDGAPRLEGCAAAVGCAIEAIHEGGDHWIVVGRVLALYRMAHAAPLIFFGGRYASIGATYEAEILVSGFGLSISWHPILGRSGDDEGQTPHSADGHADGGRPDGSRASLLCRHL